MSREKLGGPGDDRPFGQRRPGRGLFVSAARRGSRRRLVKRSVLGPFGLFGPFGPFGPFSPLGRRGLWKYAVAAGLARATARSLWRRRYGRRSRRGTWAARAWERGRRAWRDEYGEYRDRAKWPRGPRWDDVDNVDDRDMDDRDIKEKRMPRFGRGMPGFERPNGRRFDRGDVKYVLMDLLREGPRHGYDMIKEVEKRSGGTYTPSPGSVYPTLQLLEDQGLVASTTVDGKRTYRLTDAGYAFIEDRSARADDARGRAWGGAWGEGDHFRDEMRSVGREAGDLARSLRDAVRSYTPDSNQINEIRDVLGDTRKRIEAIFAERRDTPRDEDTNKPTTV